MIAATTTTTTTISTYADECVAREWQGNRNRVLCTEKFERKNEKACIVGVLVGRVSRGREEGCIRRAAALWTLFVGVD